MAWSVEHLLNMRASLSLVPRTYQSGMLTEVVIPALREVETGRFEAHSQAIQNPVCGGNTE